MNESTVPIVPAGMIRPFCDAIARSGFELKPLLERVQIPLSILDQPGFPLPAQSFYDLANRGAELLKDPYFGYRVGSETAFEKLPNLRTRTRKKQPLGAILCGMIEDVGNAANHAHYSLTVKSKQTTFLMQRQFHPSELPAQMDAFGIGFMLRIHEFAVGERWDPRALSMTVCDPDAVPNNVLPKSSLRQGDSSGNIHVFPTAWLYPDVPEHSGFDSALPLPSGRVDIIRALMQSNLNDPDLTCEKLGQLCGKSKRTLHRVLAAEGTTFFTELAELRLAAAKAALADTSHGISVVAKMVGFSHGESFSRSFKDKTGLSPNAYRKAAQRHSR